MARVAPRGCAAIRAASSTVSSRTAPGSQDRSAKPNETNSSAPTQSDVSRIRAACCQPIAAGKRKLLAASAGTPSSAKGTRSLASVATRTRSQWARRVKPSPTATPLTAARRGTEQLGEAVEESDEALTRAFDGGTRGDGRHFRQVLS